MTEQGGQGPAVSPDGRFFWDGTKWVPMPGRASRRHLGLYLLLLVVGLGIVSAVIATVALGSSGVAPVALPAAIAGHSIRGTFTLNGENDGLSAGCSGTNGYDDIHSGTAVTIRDEAAKVIGISSLGSGSPRGTACEYRFTVSGLPDVSYYAIEVSHRGSINYSKSDLQAKDWAVSLELGH